MAPANITANQIWTRTVSLVKDRVNNRSLWEAIENVVGIVVADDTLIIGMNSRYFNLAGHMSKAEYRTAIERAVAEVAGRPLAVRLIEGDSLADWVTTQERDRRVAAMRASTYERKDRAESESQSWDTLYEMVVRNYSATQNRSLPQSRARYMAESLRLVCDAMDVLYKAPADDAMERLLARVIDRIAANVEIPAAMVAYELERLRAVR